MRLTIIMSVVLVAVTLTPSAGETEDVLSIGQRFHYETSYGDSGARAKNPLWGKQIPLYKEYPDVAKIQLPEPGITDASLETVVSQRKSVRSFADKSLTVEQLSRLLVTADGITHTSGSWQMRSAPSGGALYPIDIYVIASNVESLDQGLYHFQVSDSSLELVAKGDYARAIHVASHEQSAVGSSPITVILSARFDRSTVKYSDRGYRYTYMEAGSICQNIYLQATALGLGTVAVGAFNDDSLNELLGIDGQDEAGLLIMPVGYPG